MDEQAQESLRFTKKHVSGVRFSIGTAALTKLKRRGLDVWRLMFELEGPIRVVSFTYCRFSASDVPNIIRFIRLHRDITHFYAHENAIEGVALWFLTRHVLLTLPNLVLLSLGWEVDPLDLRICSKIVGKIRPDFQPANQPNVDDHDQSRDLHFVTPRSKLLCSPQCWILTR